jgi:Cys-rich repeat protein
MKRIVILAAFALAACDPVVGSRYVKSQQMAASAGGELTIDASDNKELAGTRLSIPPNALPSNTEITVELGLDALVNSTRIASPVVVFGPQALQLNADATVVLPLSRVKTGEIITISARAADGSGYEILTPNITIDASQTHATFTVRRLGSFQAQRSNACAVNADCATGEQCVNGLCDAVCVAQIETCNGVDDDCDGIVDNGCSVVSCNSNTDCASGEWCVRGSCEADPSTFDGGSWSCTSNNDCLSGEQCVNGSCEPACVTQTETCNGVDDDCDGIVDNGCNPSDAGSFCRTNLECNPSQVCVNNTCEIGSGDGGVNLCTANTDCASGQVCSSGTCIVDTGADGGAWVCTTANDCASGEDCINGACEVASLDGGSAPFCRSDLDCDPIHPTCVNQVCQ